MSKVVNFVLGAALIVIGVVVPGMQSLIFAGASMILGGIATLLYKGPARTAAEMSLQLGEQARCALIGECATAGSLVDGFNYGGKYGTDSEVLIIRLADTRCHSLTGYFVNDQYFAFSADGTQSGFDGKLKIWFRGDTTNDPLPSVVTSHGPGWTADFTGDGGCDVIVEYIADESDEKNPTWPGGRPRFLWVVKGAFLYDPRKDDTVDGGEGEHRWDDPSTWEWSDNPIVARYNWSRGFYANDEVGNPAALLIGRGTSAEEQPPASVAAAANLCDEEVEGEKRFRADGPIYANQEHLEVEEMFAAACGGVIIKRDGAVEIEPGQAKSVAAWITDDDLLVGSEVHWNQGILSDGDRDWVNTVVARYVEPSQRWADHGAPVRRDTDDIAADGKPREASLTLRLVRRVAQASAISEIMRRLGRLWGRGTITLGPRFCELEEGDWINWTSARRFGGATKTFRIESFEQDEKWQSTLQLREISSAVYEDGDFAEDLANAAQQDAPPGVGAPDAGTWSLTAEMLDDGGPAIPILAIERTGAVESGAIRAVRFEYWRDDGVTDPEDVMGWTNVGTYGPGVARREIASIASGASYYAAVTYEVQGIPGERLILGPVTAGSITGTEGPPGLTTALAYIFKRSATAPALPSATVTFTFATGGMSGLNNGWSATVPAANGDPLYVSAATASGTGSTDTIASGEWASATIMAQDGATGATGSAGAAGTNSATVFLYQRAASLPSVPASTTTYTFATGVLSGTLGSWTQTVPAGSNPLYVTTAAAIGTGSTDTIATGEWATPRILAQDGATGATGATGTAGLNNAVAFIFKRSASAPTLPSATVTYTFATGGMTGLNNGWSAAVPAADGNPLYVSAATASGTGSTDTIASGEWASATIMAQDGATGATGSAGAAGSNAATVFLFQRNTTGSAPSVPGSTTTYTFATGVLSGTLGSWTQAVPSEASGQYLFVTTATALGTGSTDTIATGEWSTVRLMAQGLSSAQVTQLSNAVDDNVLDRDDKGLLVDRVAELGARYSYLLSRATALGVSTTAMTTAQTEFLTYLAALSPSWKDLSQDTTLAINLFTALTLDSATNTANGIYATLADPSSSLYARAYQSFTTTPSVTYTAAVVVKKDATGAATRMPAIRLTSSGGTGKQHDLTFNTQTGAIVAIGGQSLQGTAGVYALNDDEWLCWISLALNASNTTVVLDIYPAIGTSSGYSNTQTGSIDVRGIGFVLGAFDKIGKEGFRWRLKNYLAQMDAVDKAISESDVAVGAASISVLKEIQIACTSAGTPKTGALTRNETVKLMRAGVAVTSGLTWTYEVLSGGINGKTATDGAVSIAGAGIVTFATSSVEANETTVRIKAVDANAVSYSETVRVAKAIDPPSAGGSSGGGADSETVDIAITTTSHVDLLTAPLRVKTGSSGRLDMQLPLDMNWTGLSLGNRHGYVKWRWRAIAGSYADVATEIQSSPAASHYNDGDGQFVNSPGALAGTMSKTGLTANTDYELMPQGRNNTSSTTLNLTGVASAQGS